MVLWVRLWRARCSRVPTAHIATCVPDSGAKPGGGLSGRRGALPPSPAIATWCPRLCGPVMTAARETQVISVPTRCGSAGWR